MGRDTRLRSLGRGKPEASEDASRGKDARGLWIPAREPGGHQTPGSRPHLARPCREAWHLSREPAGLPINARTRESPQPAHTGPGDWTRGLILLC